MNARPTPKQIVEDALKAGLIHNHEGQAHNCPICGVEASFKNAWQPVRLPSEVGLQVIHPTPKPAPCKLLKRAKREAGNRKWIITKKQRPELFK